MSRLSPALSLSLLVVATLAACGGGGDSAPPASADATASEVQPAESGGTRATALRLVQRPRDPVAAHRLDSFSLPGFASAVDVYRPAGATRAVVFLHGGGGTRQAMAYQMGLKTTVGAAPTLATVNWAALTSAGVIAVFPQGQSISGDARTWRNHAMESGQDDMTFLKSLAAALRVRYGISDVALVGHSMGGAMVNRVRCEAPETFQSYVSISGPASSHYLNAGTPCSGSGQAPYYGLFGSADTVIPGAWDAPTWLISPSVTALQPDAFVNPVMVGEWQAFQHRAQSMCGETPALAAQAASQGAAARWVACGGRLQVQLAIGAGHDIGSIAAVIGQPAFSLVASFTARY